MLPRILVQTLLLIVVCAEEALMANAHHSGTRYKYSCTMFHFTQLETNVVLAARPACATSGNGSSFHRAQNQSFKVIRLWFLQAVLTKHHCKITKKPGSCIRSCCHCYYFALLFYLFPIEVKVTDVVFVSLTAIEFLGDIESLR